MYSQKPLVSIIIPTYNRAQLIGETLDSVLAQTYANWECIVVDDGSTDGTSQLMKEYCSKDLRFQYHHRPKNKPKGANACRNYGFELSKGEYVNWFDDDDLMHSNKIYLQLVSIIDNQSDLSVCQTLLFEDTLNNKLGLRHPSIYSNNPLNDFVSGKIKWLTPSVLFKKHVLTKSQLKFDEDLHKHQEWDFFIRFLMYNQNFSVIEEPLAFYRKHELSITYGEKTFEKHMSLFYSRYKLLANEKAYLLSVENISLIKNQLKGVLLVYLIDKRFMISSRLITDLLRLNLFNLNEKINMVIATLSFMLVGKGEKILKH